MSITDMQQRFCEEYLLDLNATQAAIRAGYSKKNADKIGPALVGKTRVAARIAELMAERSKRTEITGDMLVRELARSGFVDPRRLCRPDGSVMNLHEIDEDTARSIASLEVETETKARRKPKSAGEEADTVVRLTKVRFWDKPKCLEQIAKLLGLYPSGPPAEVKITGKIENEHSGTVTVTDRIAANLAKRRAARSDGGSG